MPELENLKPAKKRVCKKKSQQESERFCEHLENIIEAKSSTNKIVGKVDANCDIETNVIAQVWQSLFEFFCLNPKAEISLTDLNTASSVIQRLCSAQNTNSKISASKNPDNTHTQISDALKEIEMRLKLL